MIRKKEDASTEVRVSQRRKFDRIFENPEAIECIFHEGVLCTQPKCERCSYFLILMRGVKESTLR